MGHISELDDDHRLEQPLVRFDDRKGSSSLESVANAGLPGAHHARLHTLSESRTAADLSSGNIMRRSDRCHVQESREVPHEAPPVDTPYYASCLGHSWTVRSLSELERYQTRLLELEQYDQSRREAARTGHSMPPSPEPFSTPLQEWRANVSAAICGDEPLGFHTPDCGAESPRILFSPSRRTSAASNSISSTVAYDTRRPHSEADIDIIRSHLKQRRLCSSDSGQRREPNDSNVVKAEVGATPRASLNGHYKRSILSTSDTVATGPVPTALSQVTHDSAHPQDQTQADPIPTCEGEEEHMPLTPASCLSGITPGLPATRTSRSMDTSTGTRTERPVRIIRKRKARESISALTHKSKKTPLQGCTTGDVLNEPSSIHSSPPLLSENSNTQIIFQRARGWLDGIASILANHEEVSSVELTATKSALEHLTADIERLEARHEKKTGIGPVP